MSQPKIPYTPQYQSIDEIFEQKLKPLLDRIERLEAEVKWHQEQTKWAVFANMPIGGQQHD